MFKPLIAAAASIATATAIAACGSSSPTTTSTSGPAEAPPSHAQIVQDQQDMVRFTSCMRSHGIDGLPDPTNNGRAFKVAMAPNSPVAQSPAFRPAVSACQHLLPGGGQPTQGAGHTQAQVTELLAFVRCLRTHGFPNFPDPTSSGNVTQQMVAAAGVNLHQPAALQDADACTGVTHGVITRAMVARFIAGQ